jgi:hypothetical protein
MKNFIKITLFLCCWPLVSNGQTPEERGLEIAKEVEIRDNGWGDSTSNMKMLLKNKKGDESVRNTRSRQMEVENDGDKSISIFDLPRDIKGTAMLTWTHSLKADDQWLYLPALKRVKRISSKNKSGPFMGSEFAYEDLASQELDKYTHKYLKDELYENMDCFVNERTPLYKHSGYTRQLTSINKEYYRPEKIVFFDRKNAKLKTLIFRKYAKYLDKYWRAGEMFMENHQTGKSTLLIFENYKFGNGFTDRDFDKNTLKRLK